ncbi:GNAT family N-acetyltransferase [Ramlibacter sp.]|uniref:GNAT family N-acetyltransferase n=1 Tax=Ramlibacter sp. TaxID=1917967 RepID=UPI002C93FE97|nr:GNAT family N-acetyltransferase [Ramlibacter sp.]HWI84650.1 GNAT family N-acetyltransferase [Ramlibacter sp.]
MTGAVSTDAPVAAVRHRAFTIEHASPQHFAALDAAGRPAGWARLHLWPQLPAAAEQCLDLTRFAAHYQRPFAYVSMFTMPAAARGGDLATELLRATIHAAQRAPHGAEIAFFHCHPRLEPLYTRMGCRGFGAPSLDARRGVVVPMFVLGGDQAHFAACGSPLRTTARHYPLAPERKRELLALLGHARGAATPAAAGTFG